MGASITLAGESLIAQKQGNKQILDVTQFVFAYIPGLDTTQPVDRAAGFPSAANTVYTMDVTRQGYLSTNQVVYSALMASNVGDFDFNWIGLKTAEGVLLIAAYVPRQQKRKEIAPLQTGNNLTRNIVLEYDGAQSLTGVTVPASSWQFDFTAEFAAIRVDIAALQLAVANPAQPVSLDGPVLIYPGTTNTYKITDYDRFSKFTVSTTVGTVSITADVVTLVIAAGAAAGVINMEVSRDGKPGKFIVALGASSIAVPTILSPANLAVGVPLAPTLVASDFVAYPAGADIHVSSDWRIKNANGTVIWSSMGNTTNKTSIPVPNNILPILTELFPEVRFNGSTLGSTPWSSTVKFTTAAKTINKPSVLLPADGAVGIGKTPTFKLSAFATTPAGADTHRATNWRLKDDQGVIVWSSMNNVTNLIEITLPSGLLTTLKKWTLDAQFLGNALPDTAWSDSITFTTAATFEFGKYLATANIGAPQATVFGQDIDTFNLLGSPTVQPTDQSFCAQFSPDGTLLAVGSLNAPSLNLYKRSGDNFSKLANPASVHTTGTYGVAFSGDGNYLAVAYDLYPCLSIYKRDGDTFKKLAVPSSVPGITGLCVAFSPDSVYLAAGCSQDNAALLVYKRDGDSFIKLELGYSMSSVKGVTFSPDGKFLAVAHGLSPFVTIFERNGDGFTKLANPAILPGGGGRGVAFSPDSLCLAVAHQDAPFLTIYQRDGNKFVKGPNPSVLPTAHAYGVAFSKDGLHLAVAHGGTPGLTLYRRSGDVFAKLSKPIGAPEYSSYAVAFSPRAFEGL